MLIGDILAFDTQPYNRTFAHGSQESRKRVAFARAAIGPVGKTPFPKKGLGRQPCI